MCKRERRLAEAPGSRTQPARVKRAATGFEDREDHRAPFASIPIQLPNPNPYKISFCSSDVTNRMSARWRHQRGGSDSSCRDARTRISDCGVSEFAAKGEACAARVVPRGDDNDPTPSGAARQMRERPRLPAPCCRGSRAGSERLRLERRAASWRRAPLLRLVGRRIPRARRLNLSLLRSSRAQDDGAWRIAHDRGRPSRATDPRAPPARTKIASAGSSGSSRTRKRPANGMKQAQPSSTTSAVTADTRAITRRDRTRAAMTIM